ncbi:MAG: RDD family protein, partial [Candidatus Nanopelagicales bacterium]
MNPLDGDPTDAVPVIGEAVALDLRVAQLPSRTLALAIDLLVQVPLLILVSVLAAWASTGLDPALTAALALVGVVAVLVGYPTLVETLSHG